METLLPTLDEILGNSLTVLDEDTFLFDGQKLDSHDVLEAIQNWVDEYGEAV